MPREVYRKSTHTDQHLQWNIHHNLAAKYSIISTLTHRAKAVYFNPQLLKLELQYLEEVLLRCKYPKWAINRMHMKKITQKKSAVKNKNQTEPSIRKKCRIVITYIQCQCESYKSICNKCGIQVHCKGGRALKNLLVSPKDKEIITQKNGIRYCNK